MSTSAKEGNRTDRRIINEIEKLNASIAVKDRSRAILIADSKGRELRKQRNRNTHLNIQYTISITCSRQYRYSHR